MTSATRTREVPERAQVVIIGGGVIGASTAFHLADRGWSDVVVLERHELTAGSTWHAAGLIVNGVYRSQAEIELAKYTRDLYATLEQRTGFATGFDPVGLVVVAASDEHMEDARRTAAMGRRCGLDPVEVSPAEIAEMFPPAHVDDLVGGIFEPNDGRANPVDVTMSLARGAQAAGVTVAQGVSVTGITTREGRVTGVETDHGPIEAEFVVNCAGMWAGEVAAMAGVLCPVQAVEHYYVIFEGVDGVRRDMPVIDDPSNFAYYREEAGGLLVGLFEPEAAAWALDGVPPDFAFKLLDPDYDRVAPHLESALRRVPGAVDAGIRQFLCGPESFTPDMVPLVGEASELANFFVAAGMSSQGILMGGGIGKVLADWIIDGVPSIDITGHHIDRFLPHHATRSFRQDRSVEILGEMYRIHYPNSTFDSARDIRRTPLHHQLADAGAHFTEATGWETPDWFAPSGVEPVVEDYRWGRQNWFEYAAAEHRACREDVVLFDMSFMSKFLVQGRDAQRELNRICTNDVAVPVGRIVYTQCTNEAGLIEADITVTRRSEDSFLVVTSDLTHRHVETWLRRNIADGAHVAITDITAAEALLSLQGPRSRALLEAVCAEVLDDDALPYLHSRQIEIGYAPVRAVRVTYVGELGYELYVPAEMAHGVHARLLAVGAEHQLRHAGLQALDSLRLEKGYRDFGHDITNLDTPIDAGLRFVVKLDKPAGFLGRDALAAAVDAGPPKRRLVQFLLDDPEPLLSHAEVIHANGLAVGHIRSGAYGHTLGASVGLGYVELDEPVTSEVLAARQWEIDVAGVRHRARASIRPLFDPRSERVRPTTSTIKS